MPSGDGLMVKEKGGGGDVVAEKERTEEKPKQPRNVHECARPRQESTRAKPQQEKRARRCSAEVQCGKG